MSDGLRHPASEGFLAARNALALGTSLALTTGIALMVRLIVPRFLGPAAFGEFRLAESFAEMLFVVLTFGVDMHLRREAAVDASRARQYLSGLTTLRLGLAGLGIAAAVVLLRATGATDSLVTLFTLIAVAQTLLVLNNSYAALEHATGDVTWLARTNLGLKVLWAGAMVAALLGLATGFAVAAAGLAIEAVRFAWFTARARARHGLLARPDVRLAIGAILASLPFFLNSVAHNFYARIGIGWLGAVSGDVQVGLYGAASNIATVALLGMPLLSWVLVPSAARAAADSRDEMDRLVAGALRISLLMAVPVALVCHVFAAPILALLFGPEYLPAAPILRILAPTFGLAYVSTICAIALLQDGRAWTVAGISIAGVAVTLALSATLIPWGARALGTAGGGQGAAWATLITEVVVTIILAGLAHRSWRNASLLRTAAALAVGVAGFSITAALLPQSDPIATIAAAVVFVALVGAIGGITRADIAFTRQVLFPGRRLPATLSPEVS